MLGEEFKKVEELGDQVRAYVNTKIAQVKLDVAEKLSNMIAFILAAILAGLVLVFFILFGSIAAAYGIGEVLGKRWLGFLVVAMIYLLLGSIIWLAREKLLKIPIMNAIIRQLFSKDKTGEKN